MFNSSAPFIGDFLLGSFEMNWETQSAVKIMTTVPFPSRLKYPQSLSHSTSAGGDDRSVHTCDGEGADVVYVLYAIVVHSGTIGETTCMYSTLAVQFS